MTRTRATLRATFRVAAVCMIPTAFAQSASHDVSVAVPSTIGIRLVGAGAGSRTVAFDYASDVGSYVAAAETRSPLLPTSVNRFEDIEVNVNGFGLWSVYVQATPFVFTGTGTGAGLALEDVGVARGSVSGLAQDAITVFWFLGTYDTEWTLSTNARRIARSLLGTGGWRSLGFNGWDYALAIDGDEDAGTYTTTVTYYLTFP